MKYFVLKVVTGLAIAAGTIGIAAAHPGGSGGGGRFDRLDANGDGKITAEEVEQQQQQRELQRSDFLSQADKDGDGAVSKQEMQAFHEARRAERREMHNPDKNGDGVIDQEEYMNAAGLRFDRLDKNDDGVIGEDEKRRPRRRR